MPVAAWVAALGMLLVTLLAVSGCAPRAVPAPRTSAALTFTQPVQAVGQDPFVTEWQHRYLLIQAQDDDEIWIDRSPVDDLTGVSTRGTGARIWRAPQHGDHCTDLWAPELHHIGTRWVVYYAATTCDGNNDNHRMFALESVGDDPLGPYKDAGAVRDSSGRWAIDGTRISWHGTDYFVWSGWPDDSNQQQDLFIARMSGPTRLSPTADWERIGAPIEEGPEALVHGGRLFLVYSASGSWTDDYAYGLLSLTGDDPMDPASWSKSPKPVFTSTVTVFSPGHGSFVHSPDGREDWMVYHTAITEGSGWDRQIDMQRYRWRSNGTPDFGTPADPTAALTVPSGQLVAGP